MSRLYPSPHIAGVQILPDRFLPSPSFDERIVKPARRRRGDRHA
jgi:hypothetical protein